MGREARCSRVSSWGQTVHSAPGLGPQFVQNLGYCQEVRHMNSSPLTDSETSPPYWGCCSTAASGRSSGDAPSLSPAGVALITLFWPSNDTGCCQAAEAGSSPHAKLQGLHAADKSLCKPQGLLQIKTITKKKIPPKKQNHQVRENL